MHSDKLYLRCTFCNRFVLLARTNADTRQFADFVAVESFIKLHLKCNPYYKGDNLLGVSGFDVFAWSDCIYSQVRMENTVRNINDAIGDTIRDVLEE